MYCSETECETLRPFARLDAVHAVVVAIFKDRVVVFDVAADAGDLESGVETPLRVIRVPTVVGGRTTQYVQMPGAFCPARHCGRQAPEERGGAGLNAVIELFWNE